MPQTSYAASPTIAVAGMLADTGDKDIASYPAAEVIPAGRVCVLKSDGTCELPKNEGALPTSGAGAPIGVSCYLSASPPGGYQIGDMVPLVRKGRVWAEFEGTGATDLEVMNVRHSSTVATHRGKVTDAATSTSEGVEISALPRTVARKGTTGLALVEVNLP